MKFIGRSARMLALTTLAWNIAAPAMAQNAVVAQTGETQGVLPAGTIAVVNGVSIPASQLDEALQASRQPDTPQVRQALREQLVARELFRQRAEKQGYDTKPEVLQAMSVAKVNAETQLFLKDSIRPEPVTDAQVKARYDEIVAALGKEEYKPRIITVADDTTAATVLAQLKTGAAFDQLARQYSVAPTRAAGGEMPWVSFPTPVTEGNTQGLPLPIAQALTQLPVGGVTLAPIVVGNVRVILKMDARRPTQVPPFDQAKDTVRQQLQALALQKAAANLVAGLMKNATIQQ